MVYSRVNLKFTHPIFQVNDDSQMLCNKSLRSPCLLSDLCVHMGLDQDTEHAEETQNAQKRKP